MPAARIPRGDQPARPRSWLPAVVPPRVVLLASLGLMWANFLTTSRWAQAPGALHGWRQPYFALALGLATLAALRGWGLSRPPGSALDRISLAVSALGLGAAVLSWFPPATWSQIPFLDNWVPRFCSTAEGVALLSRGAVVGWQWAFLGGYPTASDITQSLAVTGFVPIVIFGPTIGFHLLHVCLIGSIPLLVFLDLKGEDREVAVLGAALSCLFAGSFYTMFVRSGDTNSLAGVACTTLALFGSHLARRGRPAGLPVLFVGLTLTAYSHAGFLAYVVFYLALEALYYRDLRGAGQAGIAFLLALIASLPLHWELWRYPAHFIFNNLSYRPMPLDWLALARKLYYNVELLVMPWRWANDYTSLAIILVPVLGSVACQRGSRAGYYAVAALATLMLTRLNAPVFGYLFIRPVHMFVVFTGVPLAYFLLTTRGGRWLTVSVLVLVGLYMPTTFRPVPHLADLRSFDEALIVHIRHLDGNLVLIENSPHRAMNDAGDGQAEPTPFTAHFEALLPATTGKRFYAGFWDGWQWTSSRGNTVAGGSFRGRAISETPQEDFAREMRRWGVRHLLVWSNQAKAYFRTGQTFVQRWSSERWAEFELLGADTRSAVVAAGRAELTHPEPLGARVELADVEIGQVVVVRTTFHPAWTATYHEAPIAVFPVDGQLAFHAPRSGSYSVDLRYPRRSWLSAASLLVSAVGLLGLMFLARRPAPHSGHGMAAEVPSTDAL